MNLELDPRRQACICGQPREAHRFGGIARPARVRQEKKTFRIDKIENVRIRIAFTGEIGAAQSDRHELSAARNQCVAHQLVRREFPRADDQTRREFAIGDLQF